MSLSFLQLSVEILIQESKAGDVFNLFSVRILPILYMFNKNPKNLFWEAPRETAWVPSKGIGAGKGCYSLARHPCTAGLAVPPTSSELPQPSLVPLIWVFITHKLVTFKELCEFSLFAYFLCHHESQILCY